MLYLCMCLTFLTFEFEFIRKFNTMTILNSVECALLKLRKDSILTICSGRPFQVETTV